MDSREHLLDSKWFVPSGTAQTLVPSPSNTQPKAPMPTVEPFSPTPSLYDSPSNFVSPSPSPVKRKKDTDFLPWVSGTDLERNGFLSHTLGIAEKGRTQANSMGKATRKAIHELQAVRADNKL